MRHRFPIICRWTLFVLGCALVAPPALGDEVDEYVSATMEELKIPGLSIAIVHKGEPVRLEGYGLANVELEVPVTPDTIFQTGSVGKQFTAAGILLLAEDGKLKLDDPLALHFPSAPAAWHRITIRQLLTHTSGLKDYGEEEIDFRRDYAEKELLEIAWKMPLEFEPGTQWSYSNTGYMVLGILTSKLADMHWSEFQKKRIFEPAGMAATRVISESAIVKNRADGYEKNEKNELQNQEWVAPTLNTLADGAVYVTARDMAAWEAALRGRRLLNESSYDAWWTPVSLGGGITYPYGFGWSLNEQRGRRLIEHGGSWQGFRASIARYVEDGLTVVVLANAAGTPTEAIAHEIAGIVDDDLRLPDPEAPSDDPDPQRTARLEGLLKAWSAWRTTPEMGRGLAATASGSTRESYGRRRAGDQFAKKKSFTWLGDDDLGSRSMELRGETVTRIAYYALVTEDARRVYRFYLTADGKVANFRSERR
jgi:CubicO group peptidase (beta-lactamase class C family)